jgi:mono/diheme cytochrome c family protein
LSPTDSIRLHRALRGVLLLSLVGGAACRQDMHDQPKYLPLREATFFNDNRSARAVVEGTVAQGQLHEDTLLYSGRLNGAESTVFPFPVDDKVMARGRERFDIFCSPCHGRTGAGDGMVVRRGFRQPLPYRDDRLKNRTVGYLFDVITNGVGAMPPYSPQIAALDRWAIIAYVRALQLSESATVADVPQAERDKMNTWH